MFPTRLPASTCLLLLLLAAAAALAVVVLGRATEDPREGLLNQLAT